MTRQRLALLLSIGLAPAAAAAEMHPKLSPLRPLLGKTWRGSLEKPGSAKPVVDVQRWELALNGQAVRVLHSINDGDRIRPDGRLHVKTQYLKAGKWVDGRDAYYVEDPKAEVRFK